MARYNRQKPISIVVQEMRLRRQYSSLIIQCGIKNSTLTCTMRLQPSPESITYTVRILYKAERSPRVWMISPEKTATFAGEEPHHLYGHDTKGHPELCVFHPQSGEWNHQMFLADAFVPWIITWLSAYEYWQVTGLWLYPEIKNGKAKEI